MSETEIQSEYRVLEGGRSVLTITQCAGGVPCESCRGAKMECVYDEESDGRRKIMLKRQIKSLEKDRGLLIRLVGSLHDSDEIQVTEIINLIRGNASLAEIQLFLTESHDPSNAYDRTVTLSEANSEVRILHALESNIYRGYMDVRRLLNKPK